MNGALVIMGYIYNPDGFDWMNFKVSKDNPYTFHHILEKRNGGGKTIENGAPLTLDAHTLLNMLERYCPSLYEELQNIFKRIIANGEPPTNDMIKEIDLIIYRALFTTESMGIKESNLIKYRTKYLEGRKELKKCLE